VSVSVCPWQGEQVRYVGGQTVCVRVRVRVERVDQKDGHESGIRNGVYACFTVMLAPGARTDWRSW